MADRVKNSDNYNDKSPYTTYTKIADIASTLGNTFLSSAGKSNSIAGMITEGITGLAKIKDIMSGRKLTNNGNNNGNNNNNNNNNNSGNSGAFGVGGVGSADPWLMKIAKPVSTGLALLNRNDNAA